MASDGSEEADINYKLILIGNSSVGKTCIFKKINTGIFVEKSISTIGVDRRTLYFDIQVTEGDKQVTKRCEINLWDTAGQERFRSITSSYYKAAQGLILLYDITKKESFEDLEKWITSIKDSLSDDKKYLIVLLGNKLDLVEGDPSTREVTLEEAKAKAEECGMFFGGECSAKDFTDEQLKELFTKFIIEIYNKIGIVVAKGEIVQKNDKKSKCC